jgi:hypothetical protein
MASFPFVTLAQFATIRDKRVPVLKVPQKIAGLSVYDPTFHKRGVRVLGGTSDELLVISYSSSYVDPAFFAVIYPVWKVQHNRDFAPTSHDIGKELRDLGGAEHGLADLKNRWTYYLKPNQQGELYEAALPEPPKSPHGAVFSRGQWWRWTKSGKQTPVEK